MSNINRKIKKIEIAVKYEKRKNILYLIRMMEERHFPLYGTINHEGREINRDNKPDI